MIRIPSSWVVLPSVRRGRTSEPMDPAHLPNGIRSWGSTYTTMHSRPPLFPRLSQGGSPVPPVVTPSPPPLSLSLHALLNQFRISFYLRVRSLPRPVRFLFTSSPHLLLPLSSLLAITASIETPTTVIFPSCIVYSTARPLRNFTPKYVLCAFWSLFFSIRMRG